MAIDPATFAADPIPSHVEMTAGVCGGKPRISGSRIRVQDVVIWHDRMGQSADEIVSRFPQLTLAGVYAALAYYHDHREQIESDMSRGRELVQEMRRLYPSKLPTDISVNE